MTPTEVEKLLEGIGYLCPRQAAQTGPEAAVFWQEELEGVRFLDGVQAVKNVSHRADFVSLKDLLAEVRTIRLKRLEGADVIEPNVDPDNVLAWQAEMRALRAAAADGTLKVEEYRKGGVTLTGADPLHALTDGSGNPEVANPALTAQMERIAREKTVPRAE
jgi:hypothetical protein